MIHLPLFLFLYIQMSLVSFHKKERLSSRNAIQFLFKEGHSFVIYPYKVIYHQQESKSETAVLITIPKRNFKKAVHRNLLKRKTKEAYRLNKHKIHSHLKDKKYSLNIGIVYIGTKELPYEELSSKIILILNRLIAENE